MPVTPLTAPEEALCLGCGYSLRSLTTHRCPECGRTFDPADPSTWREAGKLAGWRKLARPPRWWHLVLVSLLTAWALHGASMPSGAGLSFICFSVLALPVIGADYIARMVASFADRLRAQTDLVSAHRGRWHGWIVTPVCAAILASALATAWPLPLRFALSKPGFERKALALLEGSDTHTGPQWIGLYRVQRIELLDPDVVCLEICSGGALGWSQYGFAFDPHRRLPLYKYSDYRPLAHPDLGAPWRLYVYSW